MEFVKKNLLILICGVVAILAIVLVFYPIGGMFESLQTDMSASQQMHEKLTSVAEEGRSRHMPVVTINSTDSPPLGVFPTEAVYDKAVKVATKMKEESDKLVKTATEYNRHDPLVPGALPLALGNTAIEFRNAYHQEFLNLLSGMKATANPTQDDLQKEAERQLKAAVDRVPEIGGVRNQASEQAVRDQFAEKVAPLIPDQVKAQRASQGLVYANLNSFDRHAGIPANSAERPRTDDIWIAQVGLWIQEDIASAIAETNKGSSSVLNAPVKRLVSIAVDREYLTRTGKLPMNAAGPGVAAPAGEEEGRAAQPSTARVFRFSPTGRVSGPDYDIVNFTVVVEADADRFRSFLANLCNQRLITVRDIQIVGVDRERRQRQGFVYGESPVVRVQVRCEAVFLHDWAVKYMPEPIRKLLQIQTPTAQKVVDANR